MFGAFQNFDLCLSTDFHCKYLCRGYMFSVVLFRVQQRFVQASLSRMGANREVLTDKLTKALEPSVLEVDDLSDGCGSKYHLLVVSPKFEGKPLIQRHRLVNQAISQEMPEIHAVTIKALTPEQWSQTK